MTPAEFLKEMKRRYKGDATECYTCILHKPSMCQWPEHRNDKAAWCGIVCDVAECFEVEG